MARPPAPAIPLAADEVTTLNAFLDYHRAALLDRAWGLDHAQMNTTLAPSTLSLARLIGHMVYVEYTWFFERFDGLSEPAYAIDIDWDADPDAEMARAEALPTDQLLAEYEEACADSRQRTTTAESLDQLSVEPNRDGDHWSLRWILVHMIEEYARHCGHADLIRESIDGDTAG